MGRICRCFPYASPAAPTVPPATLSTYRRRHAFSPLFRSLPAISSRFRLGYRLSDCRVMQLMRLFGPTPGAFRRSCAARRKSRSCVWRRYRPGSGPGSSAFSSPAISVALRCGHGAMAFSSGKRCAAAGHRDHHLRPPARGLIALQPDPRLGFIRSIVAGHVHRRHVSISRCQRALLWVCNGDPARHCRLRRSDAGGRVACQRWRRHAGRRGVRQPHVRRCWRPVLRCRRRTARSMCSIRSTRRATVTARA